MQSDTVCRTVRQYSREPISREDMRKLQEIAEDYCTIKNYVYTRYGGIASLSKLYPGYTIQNEMTDSGLRTSMKMPSVYFYLAIFDALKDIKSRWTGTKSKVLDLIGKNDQISVEEKHYLRFLVKVDQALEAVLNQKEIQLPKGLQEKYEELVNQVDTEKMNRYLRRQVRKYHGKQHTEKTFGFSVSHKAYRYENQGIYLAAKEKRKRIFVPLTDRNQYGCQIYVRLYPEEQSLEISVPVNVTVKNHEDYQNQIGISMGIFTMLTTDQGNRYGEELGRYQTEYAEWIRQQTKSYSKNRANNPGRKKYTARKHRLTEQLHSYINHELNRFLQTEKPRIIYMAKLPGPKVGGRDQKINRKINHSVSMWQRGYIRSRLIQKCKEQSVELVEVLGKEISSQCSRCGAKGNRKNGIFTCSHCGFQTEEKVNTAQNALKRGIEGKIWR